MVVRALSQEVCGPASKFTARAEGDRGEGARLGCCATARLGNYPAIRLFLFLGCSLLSRAYFQLNL